MTYANLYDIEIDSSQEQMCNYEWYSTIVEKTGYSDQLIDRSGKAS